jgi:palmitoyltransferase
MLLNSSNNALFSCFSRYGIYERCRELVEAGYDVRQPDKENVTLLHWAAINNRIDLVKYVLSVLLIS